jgi:hypothetical protein
MRRRPSVVPCGLLGSHRLAQRSMPAQRRPRPKVESRPMSDQQRAGMTQGRTTQILPAPSRVRGVPQPVARAARHPRCLQISFPRSNAIWSASWREPLPIVSRNHENFSSDRNQHVFRTTRQRGVARRPECLKPRRRRVWAFGSCSREAAVGGLSMSCFCSRATVLSLASS